MGLTARARLTAESVLRTRFLTRRHWRAALAERGTPSYGFENPTSWSPDVGDTGTPCVVPPGPTGRPRPLAARV